MCTVEILAVGVAIEEGIEQGQQGARYMYALYMHMHNYACMCACICAPPLYFCVCMGRV